MNATRRVVMVAEAANAPHLSRNAATRCLLDTTLCRKQARSRSNDDGTTDAITPVMLFIIIVLLALALGGGGWGHSRYGYASWSPLGLIVVIGLVLLLTGSLHV
jgi:hypothetical protein